MTTSATLPLVPSVRRAHPNEAALLTDLALAAKAHWGYSPSFMAAAAAELTITASDISQYDIHVAVLLSPSEPSPPVGVYRLTPLAAADGDGFDGELSYLWVHPSRIRHGLGSLLWEDAMRRAAAAGVARLSVDADPHAEGFYVRMGAERYGEVPSRSAPGRMLPLMAVDVGRALAVIEERKKEKEKNGV